MHNIMIDSLMLLVHIVTKLICLVLGFEFCSSKKEKIEFCFRAIHQAYHCRPPAADEEAYLLSF